jgi:hypothetical protein
MKHVDRTSWVNGSHGFLPTADGFQWHWWLILLCVLGRFEGAVTLRVVQQSERTHRCSGEFGHDELTLV